MTHGVLGLHLSLSCHWEMGIPQGSSLGPEHPISMWTAALGMLAVTQPGWLQRAVLEVCHSAPVGNCITPCELFPLLLTPSVPCVGQVAVKSRHIYRIPTFPLKGFWVPGNLYETQTRACATGWHAPDLLVASVNSIVGCFLWGFSESCTSTLSWSYWPFVKINCRASLILVL